MHPPANRPSDTTATSTTDATAAGATSSRGSVTTTGNITRFTWRSRIAASQREVFDWHTRPGALERLTPPWQHLQVLRRRGDVTNGGQVTVRMRVAGVPVTWTAEHRDYVEPERFSDVQIKGPFAYWSHVHRIEAAGDDACELIDEIDYRLPLGGIGSALGGSAVRRMLERTFAYRHALIADDIALHRSAAQGRTLTIAVTGSHGLVAGGLLPLLSTGGHEIKRIVRRPAQHEYEVGWSPDTGALELGKLEGVDAVVHLAGESIMGRWTDEKKRRIRESRVQGTRQVAEALAKLDQPPRVLISASAVGYYGSRGDELLTEQSEPGDNFLAKVAREWEQATQPAADAGIRVVNPRIGLVVTPAGGALGSMLPAFRAGLGGPLGRGKSWWSWITRDDLIGGIYHAICDERVRGPMNAVAPAPVTNRTFTKVLGRVLHRPTLLPVPYWPVRLAVGELADAALFASTRARPGVLEATGYRFRDPELEPALARMLGREV